MKTQDLQAVALARQGLSPTKIGELLGRSKEEVAFKVTFDTEFQHKVKQAVAKSERDLEYNAEEPEFDFEEELEKLMPLAITSAREILDYGENEAVKAGLFKWLADHKTGKHNKGVTFNVSDLNLRLENAQKRVEENFVDVDSY